MAIKHFFFDMDNTICESRTVISNEIKDALNKLPNVYVISGASRELMEKQLKGVNCKILAQNGNDTDKWVNHLSQRQKNRIKKHVALLERKYKYGGGIEDRGCQISYSFIGHNADLKLKKKFDPDNKVRQKILQECPFTDSELVISIAGTTCFDYNVFNGTKGANLKEYIKTFKKNECIYFGDKLEPNGNDHTVVGVMETVPVTINNILEKLK